MSYFRTNKEEAEKNLNSRDIVGNNPGSKTLGNFHSRERRQVREIGQNGDIVGS